MNPEEIRINRKGIKKIVKNVRIKPNGTRNKS